MTRYHTVTHLSLMAGADETEVGVSYVVHWGRPETPPSYCHGGMPADPDEIDDVRVDTIDGKTRPWNVAGGLVSDEQVNDHIVGLLDEGDLNTAALEQEAARGLDPDDARDRRRDDEMMGVR